jgi:hypothetical protein
MRRPALALLPAAVHPSASAAVDALMTAVLVAVVLLLTGCIIAPPPPVAHEYRYPAYHDWRLY